MGNLEAGGLRPKGVPAHIIATEQDVAERDDILRSGRAALCFSGGKDSVACLLLLRPYLETVHVIFANPGKHYPETLRIAERAKAICPNWIELHTDRDAQWKAQGLASDLVPVDWTLAGHQVHGPKPILVQSYIQCCWENIGLPVWKKAKELGCTMVIRGQRNDEERKATSRTGTVLDGMEFWHPIERWTRWETLDYVRHELGRLPAHFHLEHSSLDCYDCPAYSRNGLDRDNYTRTHHPELHREYAARVVELYGAMREQMNHYDALLARLPVAKCDLGEEPSRNGVETTV